jgi:RNA polymerase sigma-70 factor (ECF subfamily)
VVSDPSPREEEEALVARLRAGDSAALEAAYSRHKVAVHRFLCRLVGRHALADDLFQETWLRLARSARRLREDTRLHSWLLAVAHNLVRDHTRGSRTDRASQGELANAPGRTPDTPYDLASAGEAERRLEAALASLPVAQREAVLLVAIERLEPADAARVAGVSPEAFRQRLARGRSLLRNALPDTQPAAREGGAR